jgi:hypothetical protein
VSERDGKDVTMQSLLGSFDPRSAPFEICLGKRPNHAAKSLVLRTDFSSANRFAIVARLPFRLTAFPIVSKIIVGAGTKNDNGDLGRLA